MIRKAALLALCTLAVSSTFAQAPWSSANELILGHKFNPQWSAFSTSRLQFGQDFNKFNLWFADVGFHYKFHKNFNVGAAYRYLEYRISDDWKSENRALIQGHWFGKIQEIRLRNRSRAEFRFYDFDRDNDIRFRNQTRAEFPWGIKGVKPYIEDEFFYSKNQKKINQNWLTGGVYFKPAEKTKIRLAYRWITVRSSKTTQWHSANQLYFALIQGF